MSGDGKKKAPVGTIDAIRAGMAEEARRVADTRVFTPTTVWMVVASALEPIGVIVAGINRRSKAESKAAYEDLAAMLRRHSGLPKIAGESVRQYFPRIMGGKYDSKLVALGYRRVGNRIEAIVDVPEAENLVRNNAVAATGESLTGPTQRTMLQRAVRQPPPDDTSDDATPNRLR
jgi:hypothetical protein